MAEVLRGRHGGITGLLTLPPEKWQAIEADLLERGKTRSQMGTPELPWSAVVAMVKHAAPGSAVYRVEYGDRGRWSDVEHLLASVVDLLNLLVWFGTKDGQKNQHRPKPVARPGEDEPNRTLDTADVNESGAYRSAKGQPLLIGAAMTIAEMDEFLKN